jgi:hypothetical protein
MSDWALFLDDERFPPDDGRDWCIARTCEEAFSILDMMDGLPSYMSLDHDLGEGQKTGMDFINMFINDIQEWDHDLPRDFSFYIHSQNPVGAENMRSKLSAFIEFWTAHKAEERGG